jgi:hypothetical protein
MKTSSIIVFALLITFPLLLTNFALISDADINQDIVAAISSGDSKTLAIYFNKTIDITVPEKEGTFSKEQAELIIKDFFAKNLPKSFKMNNQGSSKGGTLFTIGSLVTAQGKFRTYFLIKQIADKYYIQQLQFEKE